MKLYRGLKTSEPQMLDAGTRKRIADSWRKVLARRAAGDVRYPNELNAEILELERLHRLSWQNFTDRQDVALAYARQESGSVIEIDVPLTELERHFEIEFQNFGKRKRAFELVYVVRGDILHRMAKKWRLKTRRFS